MAGQGGAVIVHRGGGHGGVLAAHTHEHAVGQALAVEGVGADAHVERDVDLLGAGHGDGPLAEQVDTQAGLGAEAAAAQILAHDHLSGLGRGGGQLEQGLGRGGRRRHGGRNRRGGRRGLGRHIGRGGRGQQHGRGRGGDDDHLSLIDGLDGVDIDRRLLLLVTADEPGGDDGHDQKKNDDKQHRFDFSGCHRGFLSRISCFLA